MKKTLLTGVALLGLPFAAFAQEVLSSQQPSAIILPPAPAISATLDGKAIKIELSDTKLILAKNERFVGRGLADQECGFAQIANVDTGEIRYVDVAGFLSRNPGVVLTAKVQKEGLQKEQG